MLDLADGTRSDVLDRMEGKAVVDHVHDPCAHRRDGNERERRCQDASERCKVYVVRGYDLVDGIAKEDGHIKLEDYGQGSEQDAGKQQEPVAADEPEDLEEGLPAVGVGGGVLAHAITPCGTACRMAGGRSSGNWE